MSIWKQNVPLGVVSTGSINQRAKLHANISVHDWIIITFWNSRWRPSATLAFRKLDLWRCSILWCSFTATVQNLVQKHSWSPVLWPKIQRCSSWYLSLYSSTTRVQIPGTCTRTCTWRLSTCTCTWYLDTCTCTRHLELVLVLVLGAIFWIVVNKSEKNKIIDSV